MVESDHSVLRMPGMTYYGRLVGEVLTYMDSFHTMLLRTAVQLGPTSRPHLFDPTISGQSDCKVQAENAAVPAILQDLFECET